MKQTILMRICSVALVLAMLMCITPMTVFAAEQSAALTPAETIEKEMAERSTITKDRSQIKDGSEAAVYNNGVLYQEGSFVEMWKIAIDLAQYVRTDDNHHNTEKSGTVEFVLNDDVKYDATWFAEKTMTVSNKKLTIDLNGHLLYRNDQDGSVIIITDSSIVSIMDSNPTAEIAGNVDKNNIWAPADGGTVKINGGVIGGGYHSTADGGGLYIDEYSTVYMIGGTIAGNKADVGSAVYLEDGSVLDMSRGNSQICYNYSAGTTTDGGAIFLRSGCTVIGG